MCEAGGEVKLNAILRAERYSGPPPKSRRAQAHVDRHVEDLAFEHLDQFALTEGRRLQV